MKLFSIISFSLLLLAINCKEEKQTNFDRYRLMDKSPSAEKLFNPSKKTTIPFIYNKIYDPFLDSMSHQKASYQSGNVQYLKIHVIDSTTSSLNVGGRKRKEKIVKGFSVIIENTSGKDTMYLPLHRGGAVLIQEVKTKDKKNQWKPIENPSQEKIGQFYYKIYPKEYIYTKIPIYKGKSISTFRVKLELNDSTTIYSKEYESSLKNRWLR
ncbi:MAG: hypothetical protein ACPGVD_03665 [Flavobacteriales bacterium]